MIVGCPKEIFEYLKSKLEIPDNVVSFSIHCSQDDILKIDLSYYPKLLDETNSKQ